jgi:uncharacterized repeat protein (TIGR03803 family)
MKARFSPHSIVALAMLVPLCAVPPSLHAQHRFTRLHSFGATNIHDGRQPNRVLEASDGRLYGTTLSGGSFGWGTIFKVNRDGTGFSILHHFQGSPDGKTPAGLTEGTDGFLYGATGGGGTAREGTLFKVNKDGSGYAILHQFLRPPATGNTLWHPSAGPIVGSDGALYGVTSNGGTNRGGGVFKVNRDGSNFRVLHSFPDGPNDGGSPQGLVEGRDGQLYGTTVFGGRDAKGTVFRLSRNGANYRVIHHFKEIYGLETALLEGSDGALFGATSGEDGDVAAVVVRLKKDGTAFRVLHTFRPTGGDGWAPLAPLVKGDDGALYGTTRDGGQHGQGVVFRLNEDGSGYRVVWSFTGGDEAGHPLGFVQSRDGAIYGATLAGGEFGGGTLFRLAPHR